MNNEELWQHAFKSVREDILEAERYEYHIAYNQGGINFQPARDKTITIMCHYGDMIRAWRNGDDYLMWKLSYQKTQTQ